jgi:hypothetical protein
MVLTRFLSWTRSKERQRALVEKLIAGNQIEIHQRLNRLPQRMSPAEQQGYIRARSGVIVRSAIDMAIQRNLARPHEREALLEMAMEAVVRFAVNRPALPQLRRKVA